MYRLVARSENSSPTSECRICRFINGYKVKFLKVSKNGISFWRTKLICGTLDNPSVLLIIGIQRTSHSKWCWPFTWGRSSNLNVPARVFWGHWATWKKIFFMPFFFSSSLLEVGGKKVIIQEICEIKFSVRCTYC